MDNYHSKFEKAPKSLAQPSLTELQKQVNGERLSVRAVSGQLATEVAERAFPGINKEVIEALLAANQASGGES